MADLNGEKSTGGNLNGVLSPVHPVYKIDETLTKGGYAADAKATGDALAGKAPSSHVTDKNNPHGVTPAQIGAAPAGYGLGGMCAVVDSWDNATENGWYMSYTNSATGYMMYGYVTKNSDYYIIQEAWSIDTTVNNGCKAIRVKTASVWNPWEWVNPPMAAGTEYRTTERWIGAPVYKKLVVYTTTELVGNSSTATTTFAIPHGIASFSRILRCDVWYDNFILPKFFSSAHTIGIEQYSTSSIRLNLRNASIPANTKIYMEIAYMKP